MDHGLRRDARGIKLRGHKDFQEYSRVFNAMGRRFMEVHPADPGWHIWDETANEFVRSKALDFVARLNELRFFSFSVNGDESFSPDFRVLACELL